MADNPDDILRNKDRNQEHDSAKAALLRRKLDLILGKRLSTHDENPAPVAEEDTSGDSDAAGEGESAMGSMIGGAVSKGDSDGRMTKKKENRIMRAASVTVRSMADKGDAMTKATGGNFNTIESDLRRMSGADLNAYMSTNPTHMAKTGETWVRQEMIGSGHKKELDVLSHGTMEAAQREVKKDIVNALMSKPMAEMTPDEVRFIQDKLSELGVYSGQSDGDLGNGKLQAAIGGMIAESHAMQEMVKSGTILLSSGGGGGAPARVNLSPVQSSFAVASSPSVSAARPSAEHARLKGKNAMGFSV
jgi:hypothetical protein